jgi:hypothetical protein
MAIVPTHITGIADKDLPSKKPLKVDNVLSYWCIAGGAFTPVDVILIFFILLVIV